MTFYSKLFEVLNRILAKEICSKLQKEISQQQKNLQKEKCGTFFPQKNSRGDCRGQSGGVERMEKKGAYIHFAGRIGIMRETSTVGVRTSSELCGEQLEKC